MKPPLEPVSSARYWLPRLEQAGMAMPATLDVPIDALSLTGICDFEPTPEALAKFEAVRKQIESACDSIGYPCFLRTDESSAKHDGPNSYRIDGPDDITRCVARTLEDNLMKDLLPTHFLVRKWLDLKAGFTAFRGHQMAREFRIFAKSGEVLCVHPYWPQVAEDAVLDASTPDFVPILRQQGTLTADEDQALRSLASRASEQLLDAWSLDFAQDQHGHWWLIDAALMRESFHDYTCPNCPEHIAERYRPDDGQPSLPLTADDTSAAAEAYLAEHPEGDPLE